ncbi:MAG: phosphate ABC transporter substrate-binding protein PstS, partial [Gemmataceae bacterium]|nr:phosphate ABC transporter substrate-binding protein PstS [Gemmataceae bacterium]
MQQSRWSTPIHRLRKQTIAIILVALTSISGCRGNGSAASTRITAGGATFIDPLMQKWSAEYRRQQGVEIDYVAKGSGYGITNVINRNLAFGCTDAPMNKGETEQARNTGGDVLHIPLTLGAIAIIYHLPGVPDLILSGEVLADIYLGQITQWNDPRIAALNPGVALPAKAIVPVRRAEASGTTYVFTEYLSKRSREFADKVGVSKSPKWFVEILGKEGNAGITAHVKQTEGSLGYVELEYARKNQLATARLLNAAGKAVAPEAGAVTAAAQAALEAPRTSEPYSLHPLTFSCTDAAGETAYPIVGVSYAILYQKQPKQPGQSLVAFLKWA